MAHVPPSGDAVALELAGAYAPQPGDALALVLGGGTTPGPDPDPLPAPYRGPTALIGLAHRRTAVRPRSVAAGWQAPRLRPHTPALRWRPATPTTAHVGTLWRTGAPRAAVLRTPWAAGRPRAAHTGSAWLLPPPVPRLVSLPWQPLSARGAVLSLGHIEPPPLRIAQDLPWDDATRRARTLGFAHLAPPPKRAHVLLPWFGIAGTRYCIRPPRPEPPEPPRQCYTPPAGDAVLLVLDALLDIPPGHAVPLVLRCPRSGGGEGPGVIPIREAYIVINTFSLARTDTGEPIHARSFRAALSWDGWTWSWSAAVHASSLPLVRRRGADGTVDLTATINGIPLRLVVIDCGRDRRHGGTDVSISGKGRAAILSAPYSPEIARDNAAGALTAQQLLDDALTQNGVPIGWTLDWQIEDWLVPAGSWYYTGVYAGAATRIAEAGGAYVQGHDTDTVLHVLPIYPDMPRDWPERPPDITLPEDACAFEGFAWLELPHYNAVWVAGADANGRIDRIRKLGSAADLPAPMIVDPLATAPAATRQRGMAVLGNTGRQEHIRLSLQILPETGIIKPGQFVRYTEASSGTPVTRTGLVRSIELSVEFPRIRQTITIEAHEDAD